MTATPVLLHAQTSAITQPKNVQPKNRLTTKIAHLLGCFRRAPITLGKKYIANARSTNSGLVGFKMF